ncbi:MAG: SLC13 family permease [Bdellovibrionales bacterium]
MIVRLLPLVGLLLELLVGWSQWFGDRATVMCVFMMLWMVVWWIFEVLPLGVTALIPMVYLPLLRIVPIKEVTPHYANPVIYLFLGGFIIARALEKTRLDERIALAVLARVRSTDVGIVSGFVITTGFLSMWISNTATTVMMVPIALSVYQFLKQNLAENARKSLPAFSVVLFLAIAYSANNWWSRHTDRHAPQRGFPRVSQ